MSEEKAETQPLHQYIAERIMSEPEFLTVLENEWEEAVRTAVARDLADLREESQRILLRPENKALVEGWLLRAEDIAKGSS